MRNKNVLAKDLVTVGISLLCVVSTFSIDSGEHVSVWLTLFLHTFYSQQFDMHGVQYKSIFKS